MSERKEERRRMRRYKRRRRRRETGGGGVRRRRRRKMGRRSEGRRGWRSLHAVILLYLFLSSLSESLLASDGCQGDLLVIHCNQWIKQSISQEMSQSDIQPDSRQILPETAAVGWRQTSPRGPGTHEHGKLH